MGTKINEENPRKWGFTIFLLVLFILLVVVLGFVIYFKQLEKTGVSEMESNSYQYYIAMITDQENEEYWQSIYEGAKERGLESDAFVEMFSELVNADYSMEKQMEIAIASQVDGIILEGQNRESLRRLIEKAEQNGIPVVTVNQDISGSARISYIGMSWYETGQIYGRLIQDIIANSAKDKRQTENLKVVVLVNGETDGNEQNLLMSGIRAILYQEKAEEKGEEEIEEIDSISLDTFVVKEEGAFSEEEAIREFFLKQKNEQIIFVALSQIYTNCCMQAVVDYNRVGTTNIIGFYDSQEIVAALDKGIIDSVVTVDTEQMGEYCVEALMEYIAYGYASAYYAVDSHTVDQQEQIKGLEK